MCGRFFVDYDEDVEIYRAVKAMFPDNTELIKSGDIFPGDVFPVITSKSEIEPLRWGYKTRSKKLLINAKSETVSERLTFKNDLQRRRCIIATSGFYEWSEDKEKHFYRRKSGVVYLAGIHSTDGEFVILTRAAEEPISLIHSREPVILGKDECRPWLEYAPAGLFFGKSGNNSGLFDTAI